MRVLVARRAGRRRRRLRVEARVRRVGEAGERAGRKKCVVEEAARMCSGGSSG